MSKTGVSDMQMMEAENGGFTVRRTSVCNDESSPCEGAVRVLVPVVDVRNADDPKKIPGHIGRVCGKWEVLRSDDQLKAP